VFQKHYAKAYNLLNSSKDYKSEIEFVYNWGEQPKRIFDVGCGTASYWKYYPEITHIRGIEKSSDMIIKSGRPKEILLGDIQASKALLKAYGDCFDLSTALFDVINYIPKHWWWSHLPIKKGGYFIFDCYDKTKVDAEGFKKTHRKEGDIERLIVPGEYDGKQVTLNIVLFSEYFFHTEVHTLYMFSERDIKAWARRSFEIVEIKQKNDWKKWYKLRKK
jgi:hypothetical protein